LEPPATLPREPSKPIHHVWRRLKAKKAVAFHPAGPEKGAAARRIAALAARYKDSRSAVLIFVRTLDDFRTVEKELQKTKRPIVPLTGTMRGKERDGLVDTDEFRRFLKGAQPGDTVYLLCTAAGEVGIDISADHLVCDLTPFDSMAQRFGRVNRYGNGDALIDVVYPTEFDEKDKLSPGRENTLMLLRQLTQLPERDDEPGVRRYDASPKALGDLRARPDLPCKIEEAFTPAPTILAATDILFDAWALTTIREKLPGRPPVEPYLHGMSDWQPPETYVAWREEVKIIADEKLDRYRPDDLLEDYPLKPHELLRDRSDRVSPYARPRLARLTISSEGTPTFSAESAAMASAPFRRYASSK
jgi:CRISPR-associated endonuclease/helicase Cas3